METYSFGVGVGVGLPEADGEGEGVGDVLGLGTDELLWLQPPVPTTAAVMTAKTASAHTGIVALRNGIKSK